MAKNNTTIPPCTHPQELYLYGRKNDDPHWISQHDVDCKWHPHSLIGFHKHKDPDTGTELPNCCEHHQLIEDQAKGWFAVFPNCCDHHRSLAEAGDLKKDQYEFMPEKILLLVAQTEHVIEESINKPDWEQAITGYIDYCFVSFGLYAIGLNVYLDGAKSFLQKNLELKESEKAGKLIDYIDHAWHNFKYDELNAEFFDYDNQIVQDWLQVFPFDLEMFKNNKLPSQYFTIPLPYDISKKRFQFSSIIYSLSEQNLINYTLEKTRELIRNINASNLFQQGRLTDPEKIKLDLVLSERKLQIEKMNHGSEPGSSEYISMLKKWFTEEVTFLDKITPIIKERKDLLPDKPAMPDRLKKHYEALKGMGVRLPEEADITESPQEQPIISTKSKRLIAFNSKEVQEKVFELLKGYFPDKEEELRMALNGEQLKEKLIFPHNQNKLVEVFKRLKYNGLVVYSKYQINRWLRANFKYQYERGERREIRDLSETTIKQLFSSGKGEPKREQRICYEGIDWLPYKSQVKLEREERKEKL